MKNWNVNHLLNLVSLAGIAIAATAFGIYWVAIGVGFAVVSELVLHIQGKVRSEP